MRLARLHRAFVNLSRRARGHPRAHIAQVVVLPGRGDLPPVLNPRRLYRLGDPAKWAVLECPCGRGHTVELNLANLGRDRWTVTTDIGGRPSARPSIHVKGDRGCHYWLRAGRIHWI